MKSAFERQFDETVRVYYPRAEAEQRAEASSMSTSRSIGWLRSSFRVQVARVQPGASARQQDGLRDVGDVSFGALLEGDGMLDEVLSGIV